MVKSPDAPKMTTMLGSGLRTRLWLAFMASGVTFTWVVDMISPELCLRLLHGVSAEFVAHNRQHPVGKVIIFARAQTPDQ